jgi:coenzyme F420-0:L-glutamate ligase / coenzyme F420-1:gamma-L-glutamate ligase
VSTVDISLVGVPDLPLIAPGDDLVAIIAAALHDAGLDLAPHDVLVVASKIVAKSEDRHVRIDAIEPSPEAERLARVTEKDPRLVELILAESVAISRAAPGVLIVRHRLGFVSANAGVDFSNVGGDDELALLLPEAPDASAAALRRGLEQRLGVAPLGVVIADTHGRAFRRGNVGVAIGVAGVTPLVDERGTHDLFGRELRATVVPLADQLASAAGLVGGEGAQGVPVVIVRGLDLDGAAGTSDELLWSPEEDLFA